MGVNWAFRDLSPISAPGRNSLKFKRSPFASIYIYRFQRMNLTVNLTVKFFWAFCFLILPSDELPDCTKAYKSRNFRSSGSPGLGNHRVFR